MMHKTLLIILFMKVWTGKL